MSTENSIKLDLIGIRKTIQKLIDDKLSSEVDDYLIDIYEKLETLFEIARKIKADEELDRKLRSIGPTYRG